MRLARWTAWDRRTFARGAAVALATLALAFVVTAASDEGGLAWGVRAGRALPLAPVCAAVGAWLALAPGRVRGEDLALAALGRSPWECHAAAVVGGAVVAFGAAAAIGGVARVDVHGFYPRADATLEWRAVVAPQPAKTTAFQSDDGRWRIAESGEPLFTRGRESPGSSSQLPSAARLAAAMATAFAGIALPMLAARARSKRAAVRSLAAVGVAALVTVLAFQAAAIARAPALLAPVGPLLLLAAAASGYLSSPWRRARYPR